MKKKLLDRRGAGIELAILMMVVSFSLAILLTSVALLQSVKKVRAEERMEQSVVLEQLGQDFLSAVSQGKIDEYWLPGEYNDFTVTNDKHQCNWELDENAQNSEATCENDGSKTYKCTICGEQKVEVTPASHEKKTSNITKDATCTAEGIMEYTCSCGTQWEESIPMIPHKWVEETVEEGATEPETIAEPLETQGCTVNKKQQCSECGMPKEDNHSWNAGEVTEASCTNTGKIVYTCTACDATKEETIPVNDTHNWTEDGCADCKAERPIGVYTLTVYKTGKSSLKVQVSVPSAADDESVEAIGDGAVLKIVLHCDELTETYKIMEWTKNDRS